MVRKATAAWYDEQYDNRARVPEHPTFLQRWKNASALSRSGSSHRLDIRYGDGPNETLDLFPCVHASAPVLVFIHGGYWRTLDKSDFSYIAPSFVADGAMVVLPNYALAPAVTVDTIALQLTRALAWVHRHAALYGGDAKRIVLAGHSAGGHLATMLLACDWKRVARDLPSRLSTKALSISGLYDLEAVRRTPSLQTTLGLTPASARRCSPALYPAPRGVTLHTLVGGDESEEYLRQNRLMRERWGARAVPVSEVVPATNHFDVVHGLADPQGRLHGLALELLGLR
jgi:arylformamidase